jgi:GlpG protein
MHDASFPRNPPVTTVLFGVCVILFLWINLGADENGFDFRLVGWREAYDIWDGAWWALITSAAVHAELWHLGFNLYWFWRLGGRLEIEIGSKRYLAFLISAAFVSSAAQVAVSSDTGIGLSGVVYAIFGFMWVGRSSVQSFQEALSDRVVPLFVLWLFGCLFATYAAEIPIGNAAHFSGLFFGAAVAPIWAQSKWRPAGVIGLALCATVCVLTLLAAQWNPYWLGHQALKAYNAGEFQQSIELYSQALERDPGSGWAQEGRRIAEQALQQRKSQDGNGVL